MTIPWGLSILQLPFFWSPGNNGNTVLPSETDPSSRKKTPVERCVPTELTEVGPSVIDAALSAYPLVKWVLPRWLQSHSIVELIEVTLDNSVRHQTFPIERDMFGIRLERSLACIHLEKQNQKISRVNLVWISEFSRKRSQWHVCNYVMAFIMRTPQLWRPTSHITCHLHSREPGKMRVWIIWIWRLEDHVTLTVNRGPRHLWCSGPVVQGLQWWQQQVGCHSSPVLSTFSDLPCPGQPPPMGMRLISTQYSVSQKYSHSNV